MIEFLNPDLKNSSSKATFRGTLKVILPETLILILIIGKRSTYQFYLALCASYIRPELVIRYNWEYNTKDKNNFFEQQIINVENKIDWKNIQNQVQCYGNKRKSIIRSSTFGILYNKSEYFSFYFGQMFYLKSLCKSVRAFILMNIVYENS